eukprot:Phypoly_transcript_07769.p1 GENE.Phypoly_transcript_07769~~Phypoly_transcript_07769.p1  ORF type:complete len:275 (+),score=42.44 Phypoly_transcript_07769:83-907(+)
MPSIFCNETFRKEKEKEETQEHTMNWSLLFLSLYLFFSLSKAQYPSLPFSTPTSFTCNQSNITFAIPVPANTSTFVIHFTNPTYDIFIYNVSASTSPDLSGQVWHMIWDSNVMASTDGWLGAEIWIEGSENATTIYLVADCTIYTPKMNTVMHVEVVAPQAFPLDQYENNYGTLYIEDGYNHSHWFYYPQNFGHIQNQVYSAEACEQVLSGSIYMRIVSQRNIPYGNIEFQETQAAVNSNPPSNNAYQAMRGLDYFQYAEGSMRAFMYFIHNFN